MKFKLTTTFTFNSNISQLEKEFQIFLQKLPKTLIKTSKEDIQIILQEIKKNSMIFTIETTSTIRPHNLLLQIKNSLSKEYGKTHHIGVRNITIDQYHISFTLKRAPLKPITIPFAKVSIKNKQTSVILENVSEEFLRNNYIDRIIKRIKEKIEDQYYEGKAEFWKLIWESEKIEPVWNKDPTEEMVKQGWLKQGPTKGKWFYRPQISAIFRTMETIALEEILKPLGFQEVIESHIVPFDVWLKTGHFEGMPSEFYYVCEPKTRDPAQWEKLIDLTKITKTVPKEELIKNLAEPTAGICYAQCPVLYWSFKGTTIAESSLPILIYDKTAVSCRYESGGRHGIERVDEFHRLEPIYIGTREQLLKLRDKLLERYKYVFNTIFELEWRMAWVTPWYMQQAGQHDDLVEQDTGTIDFEAYMPYRGTRKDSEWLEFQNLSILGDKYIKAFNIKGQRSDLWSGCSGIGLERWTAAFLAQKGLDPENWPKGYKKYLPTLPKGITFV
jgi:seryl-tRNA synthetase